MTFSAVDMLTVHEHLNNELIIELITQPHGNALRGPAGGCVPK